MVWFSCLFADPFGARRDYFSSKFVYYMRFGRRNTERIMLSRKK
jgi:hypothetical protein